MKHYKTKPQLLFALLLSLLGTTKLTWAQNNPLAAFEKLMDKTWKAEGNWGDGSKFKQETIFEYALDSTLVLVHSKGFTNQEQTEYGDRNHGIRKFDKASNTLKFWEYDVFGGVTEGILFVDGKNFLYEYDYGGTLVTDLWEYIDEDTYTFKVGNYADRQWKQVYLETTFNAEQD